MPATANPPRLPQQPAASCCSHSADLTEQVARAECCLFLESQKVKLEHALVLRRTEANDKYFATLCTATNTDLTVAKVAEAAKARVTAFTQIDADGALIHELHTLVTERISLLMRSGPEAFRAALEKRLKALSEDFSREKKDTDAIEKQIHALERRLAELPPCPSEQADRGAKKS